jgi:23S rRNA (adenine2503-C2)-methyltransferase
MMLSEQIRDYKTTTVTNDLIFEFGNEKDGAIEFAGLLNGGVIEVGYFYGVAKPKNILVVSTQLGCPSRCQFCELGDELFTRSLTAKEIYEQAILILAIARRYGMDIDTVKHKVNFAKSGEPLLNEALVQSMQLLGQHQFSFKISTVFPYGEKVKKVLAQAADFSASYPEAVQLQISLISTNENHRRKLAGIRVASFSEIRQEAKQWFKKLPNHRKWNISLMMTNDMPFDIDVVKEFFDAEFFRFRLRTYVPTVNGKNNGLITAVQERYDEIKSSLLGCGYDVGDWALPTPIERRFKLASNVTRRRYLNMTS